MPDSARGPASDSSPPLALVAAAFAAVYVIWGSTYLAIRWAIETIPPLSMAAIRFFVAGGVLYGWLRTRGTPAPSRAQWKAAAIAGGLLLAGGNGAVVVAEQWIPSGLAALLVASVPLWLVVIDGLFGSRTRPSARALVGLALGFGGVGLLIGSPGVGAGGRMEVVGAGLVLAGCASWAAGSMYSRYAPDLPRPLMWVAQQMIAGAALLAVMGLSTGELGRIDLDAVSLKSALSLAYLIVFGALIAYAAYIWLLRVVTPARAGTYAYVNPVVAMLLGWALADEPLTLRSLAAATVILGAVVLITTEPARPIR